MLPPEEHKPSLLAIVPYYGAAACCFAAMMLLLLVAAPCFAGHYFQPRILALTHLAALGWGTMVIFGASNQLVPVITEQRLRSEKLPLAVWFLKITGIPLLVVSFWNFEFTDATYLGGSLILMAFVLHAVNLYRTARRAQDNIITEYIVTAHLWLVLTAVIGLLLLIHLRHPILPGEHLHYLKLHATVGMAGWFLQLMIGVSARLIPMFLLSRREEKKWLQGCYYAINVSLVLFLVGKMLSEKTGILWWCAAGLLIALSCYGRYLAGCYRSAVRKQTDQGMKQTFLALFLFVVPFALLTVMLLFKTEVPPRIVAAYGFSFFAGALSVMIVGQTFKTLPFIVWMHLLKPGKLPEILPKDLFRERWVKGQMLLYLPGYLLFLAGILTALVPLLYAGAALMTAGACWYCIHTGLIIQKLRSA